CSTARLVVTRSESPSNTLKPASADFVLARTDCGPGTVFTGGNTTTSTGSDVIRIPSEADGRTARLASHRVAAGGRRTNCSEGPRTRGAPASPLRTRHKPQPGRSR